MTIFLERWANAFNTNIKPLATCPLNAKTVGDNVSITVNISSGTAPYTITYKKDTTVLSTVTTSSLMDTYVYTTNIGDVGVHNFGATITDSCATSISLNAQCPVTIIPIVTCNTPTCNLTVS